MKAKVVRGGRGFEGVTTPAPLENFNHTLYIIHINLSLTEISVHTGNICSDALIRVYLEMIKDDIFPF